jgi:hypothetical protein
MKRYPVRASDCSVVRPERRAIVSAIKANASIVGMDFKM